jgi:hypothetical protein
VKLERKSQILDASTGASIENQRFGQSISMTIEVKIVDGQRAHNMLQAFKISSDFKRELFLTTTFATGEGTFAPCTAIIDEMLFAGVHNRVLTLFKTIVIENPTNDAPSLAQNKVRTVTNADIDSIASNFAWPIIARDITNGVSANLHTHIENRHLTHHLID